LLEGVQGGDFFHTSFFAQLSRTLSAIYVQGKLTHQSTERHFLYQACRTKHRGRGPTFWKENHIMFSHPPLPIIFLPRFPDTPPYSGNSFRVVLPLFCTNGILLVYFYLSSLPFYHMSSFFISPPPESALSNIPGGRGRISDLPGLSRGVRDTEAEVLLVGL
jgi:hypothetical protein